MKEMLQTELDKHTDWEGYIWMIEGKEPKVYKNKAITNLSDLYSNERPFSKIQEALLYSATAGKSLWVRNVDGEEKLYIHKHADFIDGKFRTDEKDLEVPGFAKSIIKKLKFRQVYQLQESVTSPGFESYYPVFKLFVGLEK
ncbi:TIGR04423 family type III CRISPR-associated protein [Marinilongibacter aquaticus]|uniref:TIGR04423 family type III CRISPR-associated protein n=1 Tax=Marinilongibacter aquaticus TaxID=2975157 RepID=UPI0021BD12BE|nr:TIGR04423 family type III CRISPR-associated protein [Marinilongibacter aquaticus]UBM60775.1 TIGR04423 family type III CRISPR-associated protein [Marinilongibacter aquaticus]